jgi:hypothetical protein
MTTAEGSAQPRHHLNDLLGMHVRFADGSDGDHVIDVRLIPAGPLRGQLNQLVTDGLVIGRRRPGTLFGYDRNAQQGPWLVRTIIRFLHRHTGYLQWSDVDQLDWDSRTVHVTLTELRDLHPCARPG